MSGTTIRRLPTVYPGAVTVADILPSDSEVSIFRDLRTLNWWRADAGWDAAGWQDRKAGALLTALTSARPYRIAANASFNNRPTLRWDASGPLSSGAVPILPVGESLTVLVVGRADTGDNAYLLSNAAVGGSGNEFYVWYNSFSNQLSARLAQTNITGGAVSAGSNAPRILHSSFDLTTRQLGLRINRGAVYNTLTAASGQSNTDGILRVGGGVGAGGGTTLAATLDTGDIAEILIFGVSLDVAANLDLRTRVETYLHSRYGI